MSIVRLDFETRSMVDIRETGVYPYAADPSTDIWCMAYAFDDEEPKLWRPDFPADERLVDHIKSGRELHAWNAQFERIMWRIMTRRYGWPFPNLDQWFCSMALAASYGLPLALDGAARALNLDILKDMEGHNLMMRMCRPRSVSDDGVPTWWDVPDKLIRLGEYCMQDVRTERAVAKRLPRPLPPTERKLWLLDQTINDRGMGLDHQLATAAKEFAELAVEKANSELASLTDGEVSITNAGSLTRWLNKNGMTTKGVAKAAVVEMLKRPSSDVVERVLRIRQEAGKSSVAKYDTMLSWAKSEDGRMHGMLQYHGAHTGRWAGRGPQPQNFPKGSVECIEAYIPLVLERDVELVDMLAPPMDVVSSMLRSSMTAPPGKILRAADYAAIEARVVAWLAGQNDLLEDYRAGKDSYRGLAGDIYHLPPESVSKTQRAVGKIAILGLGFQMGAKRFKDQCYTQGGVTISDELAAETVSTYRSKYDQIKRLWNALQAAAIRAVETPGVEIKLKQCAVSYRYEPSEGFLYCKLPSGRELKYFDPVIMQEPAPWDGSQMLKKLTAMGQDSYQWTRYSLYGGLQTENIVQAVARDILAEAMLRLEEHGYNVVLTVHDEVISENEIGFGSLEEFMELMKTLPGWATGCPVNVEGWEGERYRK